MVQMETIYAGPGARVHREIDLATLRPCRQEQPSSAKSSLEGRPPLTAPTQCGVRCERVSISEKKLHRNVSGACLHIRRTLQFKRAPSTIAKRVYNGNISATQSRCSVTSRVSAIDRFDCVTTVLALVQFFQRMHRTGCWLSRDGI